jgi:hypothetical protein
MDRLENLMPELRATTPWMTPWTPRMKVLSALALAFSLALTGCYDFGGGDDPIADIRGGGPANTLDGIVSVPGGSVAVSYPSSCDSSGLPDDEPSTSFPCVVLHIDEPATLSIQVADDQPEGDVAIRVDWSAACGAAVLNPVTANATTRQSVHSSTYTANGCTGNDVVTARVVNVGSGVAIDAAGTVNIASNLPVAIRFVSATPTKLDIAGTGGKTQATVKFKVMGESEQPVAGEGVSFYLGSNSQLAGVALVDGTDQGVTDQNGDIITRILAGTQTTPVVVTAVLDRDTGITAVSYGISVSGGPPVAGGFELALMPWNPDAWHLDNAKVDVVATLSDRNGQPVPDGTTVVFTTESGIMIPDFCQTTNSRCNVQWTSNPANHTTSGTDTSRTTIMAIVDGAERFDDFGAVENQFDDLDGFDPDDPSYDLGDFYRDDYAHDTAAANTFDPERVNGDGVMEAVFTVNGNTPDVDVDGGGLSRAEEISPNGDGFYNGPFCDDGAAGLCATLQPAGEVTSGGGVRLARSAVISVSSSRDFAVTAIYDCAGNPIDAAYLATQGCDMGPNGSITDPDDILGALNVRGSCIEIEVQDHNGNAIPFGSTIIGATSKGAISGSLAGGSETELTHSMLGTVTGPMRFQFGLRENDDTGLGVFEIKTTTGEFRKIDTIPVCEDQKL